MTVLYPNPCYNMICYKGTAVYHEPALYIFFRIVKWFHSKLRSSNIGFPMALQKKGLAVWVESKFVNRLMLNGQKICIEIYFLGTKCLGLLAKQ